MHLNTPPQWCSLVRITCSERLLVGSVAVELHMSTDRKRAFWPSTKSRFPEKSRLQMSGRAAVKRTSHHVSSAWNARDAVAAVRGARRLPLRLVCSAMTRLLVCWCSSETSVAHVLLLGRCPPGPLSMCRSPASLLDRVSECTCDAIARVSRPIRAEMAENEAIS